MSSQQFSSERALLLILGASNFPNEKTLGDMEAAKHSVEAVKNYFAERLGLEENRVKNLFNSEYPAAEQVKEITDFLEKNEGPDGDLFVYCVGHGKPHGDDLRLIVSVSTSDTAHTTISMKELLKVIYDKARAKRHYIILETCYAGMSQQIAPEIPKGAVYFCASQKNELYYFPPQNPGESTLFAGALLDVLNKGDENFPKRLSCNNVRFLLNRRLEEINRDLELGKKIHPFYYVMDYVTEKQGAISDFEIFPNKIAKAPVREDEKAMPKKLLYPKDAYGGEITWHIITSNKGGVGKTLLSMMLSARYSFEEDKGSPQKLPLVIDLNGVNMDLRRLLLGKDQADLEKSDGIPIVITVGSKNNFPFSVVKVNQKDHPFLLGWPTGNPFRLLDTTSFFNSLEIIKGEAIGKIENIFSGVQVKNVVIDTNYHFCNK